MIRIVSILRSVEGATLNFHKIFAVPQILYDFYFVSGLLAVFPSCISVDVFYPIFIKFKFFKGFVERFSPIVGKRRKIF